MSAPELRWQRGALVPIDWCDPAPVTVAAADSWFVRDGRVLALDAHRARFLTAVGERRTAELDARGFLRAAIAAIPRQGEWFPRVELQLGRDDAPALVARIRPAPTRQSTVVLAEHRGADPRTTPRVKGPDLEALGRARVAVQPVGAGEAVLLSPERFVIEGAWSSIVWWRGDDLCVVHPGLARIDSVTERVLRTIALARGVVVREELVTPDELAGLEVWALSALHGARLVTRWVEGPAVAARPGRLDAWRARLTALSGAIPIE